MVKTQKIDNNKDTPDSKLFTLAALIKQKHMPGAEKYQIDMPTIKTINILINNIISINYGKNYLTTLLRKSYVDQINQYPDIV